MRLDAGARPGGSPDGPLAAGVLGWLDAAQTRLCWVWGPAPGTTDAAVSAVRSASPRLQRDAVSFADASPDACLAELLGPGGTAPVTWARLRDFLHRVGPWLLLLGGLDGPALHDVRIRLLLRYLAAGRLPDTRVLVTATAQPPDELLPPQVLAGVTVIAAGAAAAAAGAITGRLHRPGPVSEDQPGPASGPDEDPDAVEDAIARKLATGDVRGAVDDYWVRLGNFPVLRRRGRLHLGERVCRALNGGSGPDQVGAVLQQTGWAIPVVNDWAQFARCLGDVPTAVQAALTAHRIGASEVAPWDAALLARHACEALILAGNLADAPDWAETARRHAVMGLRQSEGVPTAEDMGGVDDAAAAAIKLAVLLEGADGVERELDELAQIHERQRRVLEDLNRAPLPLPFPGPTGPVDGEALLHGWPAALAALLRQDAGAARRLVDRGAASVPDGQTLLPRVLLAEGAAAEAAELLRSLHAEAEAADDADTMCELAVLAARARLATGQAQDAEADVAEHLWLAEALGLGIRWIDLMVVRSEIARALGRTDEARGCAGAALHGLPGEGPRGALNGGTRYRMGALAAVEALRAAGAEPDPGVIATIAAQAPDVPSRPAARTRPGPPDPEVAYPTPVDRRIGLDEAARRVLGEYTEHGTPFVLYLRKFDIVVSHGPMEFGPQLLENSLRAALPEGASIVTVQDQDRLEDAFYSGSGSAADRGAPALILPDEQWRAAVEELISHAVLIVSECLMLSEGVRFELETAYRLGRWDRTVLVLPPLDGPFEVLDSDPVIQLFPRCAWANSLHTTPLIEQDVIKDLVARIAAILALPEDERRGLVQRGALDQEHPISLMPLAERYERDVTIDLTFGDQDSELLRYEAFWRLFRAGAIRGVAWQQGDRSDGNRIRLAEDYRQMSSAMLDMAEEEGQIVVRGDLVFAEQCAQSAYALLAGGPGPLRELAERQLAKVQQVQQAVEANPDRVVMRPRYGPFTVRAESAGTDEATGQS